MSYDVIIGGGDGADLASFRLTGVQDAAASLPLGSLGSEMEHTTAMEFASEWVRHGVLQATDVELQGSSVFLYVPTGVGGIHRKSLTPLPDNFEYAALLSKLTGISGMVGIQVAEEASGFGIGASPYSGSMYTWGMPSNPWEYNQTRSNGGAVPATVNTGRPYWLALRRLNGTHWRFRSSVDAGTWETNVADDDYDLSGLSLDSLGVSKIYDNDDSRFTVHRAVIGFPDLGAG